MIEMIYPKGVGRRARLWVDELPLKAIISEAVESQELILTGTGGAGGRNLAAVEVFHPRGATFHYGLLGAELMPGAAGRLNVIIPAALPTGEIAFDGALAGALDRVVVGSVKEYSDAIASTLLSVPPEHLPSGRLVFSAMAHGEIGSAPDVFVSLTMAILRLLAGCALPQNEEGAAALLAV